MTDLEKLAKPYLLKGKRHSVRTLHTALQNIAKIKGALSAERDAIYISPYDGSDFVRFAREFDDDGNSVISPDFDRETRQDRVRNAY